MSDDVEGPITQYQLNTVTYSTASAPFLTIRSSKQLAIDECHNYPHASAVLLYSFNVDDLMSGSDSQSNAFKLKFELTNLLRSGAFENGFRNKRQNCCSNLT